MGYLIILASLIILMAAGTIYGLWAEGRAKTPDAVQRLAIVNSRTRMGWWLIVIYAVAWWFGPATLNILFAVFSFFLLREFIALTPIKHTDHWVLVIAFYLAIPIQYSCTLIFPRSTRSSFRCTFSSRFPSSLRFRTTRIGIWSASPRCSGAS